MNADDILKNIVVLAQIYRESNMDGAILNEILFLVVGVPDGGYAARALGESIFSEADDLEGLHQRVRDAVYCHFDEGKVPQIIRLYFTREEIIAVL